MKKYYTMKHYILKSHFAAIALCMLVAASCSDSDHDMPPQKQYTPYDVQVNNYGELAAMLEDEGFDGSVRPFG